MRRVLSIYLPRWPIERVTRRRRGSERRDPCLRLVVSAKASRQLVEHACAGATRDGVRPGMTVAHARALLGGERPVGLIPHDPEEDIRRLRRLARWAERWSPVVSIDPPDGLLVDITGCEHLFGGEAAMAATVADAVRALGLTARLGIANTVGAAWAVSRFGSRSCTRVERGHERESMGDLPVESLRIDAGTREALEEIGIRRVAQVIALPRQAIPGRYGPDLLRRLDQALGALPEYVDRQPHEVEHRASIELPGGTTAWESVHAATRDALARLSRSLESRGLGLRELTGMYDRVDRGRSVVRVRVSRATRCTRHLWRLIEPRLERLHLGDGIERITLSAVDVDAVPQRQARLIDGDHGASHDAAFAPTLDVIADRLGRERVLLASLRESHRPERRVAMRPAMDRPPTAAEARAQHGRPSRLIEPPEPVRVIALRPDGPIGRVWRGGVELAVRGCTTPERIGGEWWRSRQPARDYFRVQVDRGPWLWLFRDASDGSWYVHGEWA